MERKTQTQALGMVHSGTSGTANRDSGAARNGTYKKKTILAGCQQRKNIIYLSKRRKRKHPSLILESNSGKDGKQEWRKRKEKLRRLKSH